MTIGMSRTLPALLVLMLGALLAGCGDGIEVNSKLFDAIGIGATSTKKDTRMVERPGLVVPPPMASLPEPGTGDKVAAAVTASLPQDPEAVAARSAAQQKKAKAQACADARNKHDDAAAASLCPGLLSQVMGTTPAE